MFEAIKILGCKQDQVIKACRSLDKGLILLAGEEKCEGQAGPTIAYVPRGYYTGSSQYAASESDIEFDQYICIQRMSLVPSGAFICDIAWKGSRESRAWQLYALERIKGQTYQSNYIIFRGCHLTFFVKINMNKPARLCSSKANSKTCEKAGDIHPRCRDVISRIASWQTVCLFPRMGVPTNQDKKISNDNS